MKLYQVAPEEVTDRIKRLRKKYHEELETAQVTIDVLMVEHDDDSDTPVLRHRGCAAAAIVSLVSPKDRAAGAADVKIQIDKACYDKLPAPRRDALLDHELYHLVVKFQKGTNLPQEDGAGRPRLAIRPHDREFGWFDLIAERHGEHAMEVVQAHQIVTETAQLYFPFALPRSKPALAQAS